MKIKSVFVRRLIIVICKYVVPVVVGYLEGDSHAITDYITTILNG